MTLELFKKLSAEEFISMYGPIHDSIFRECEMPDFPFVNRDWEIVLLPCGELNFENKVDFIALMQAGKSMGDREVVITDFPVRKRVFDPEHVEKVRQELGDKVIFKTEPEYVIIPWDPEVMDRVTHSTLGFLDTHLFGRSTTWGVVSYWDHYFAVGGNPEFMELFTQKAGGRVALKERFLDYAVSGWYVFGESTSIYKDKTRDFKMKVLKSVEWDTEL